MVLTNINLAKILLKNIFFIFFLVFSILSRLETKNFFIDIFSQISFQILLGGILLLIISIILRKLWVSIFCILVCVLLAADILPPCKNCNALLKDELQTYNKIRLMTYNTSYNTDYDLPKWFLFLENSLIKNKSSKLNKSNDLKNLHELILIENPDIIQFQEVTPNFKEKLKSLELTFPYNVGFNKFVGITESIILSKYPIKKNNNSNNDSILTKIIVNGVELNILSAHLYSGLNQYRFNLANEQILTLKKLINDISENIILIGDLNMTPVSTRFNKFVEDSNLYTYTSFLKPTFSWPSYLPSYLGIQIDHVLYSENFKMIRKKTTIHLGSDHRPLIVDLAY